MEPHPEALLAESDHSRREEHGAHLRELHHAARGAHLVVADALRAPVVAVVEVLLRREDPNFVVKRGIVENWGATRSQGDEDEGESEREERIASAIRCLEGLDVCRKPR